MSKTIVEMIRDVVILKPKPAVYLSGGLDSTIILHHLREQTKTKIYTYTAQFGLDGDETLWSKMVSEHYGTIHKIVDCSECVNELSTILEGFVHPRYNVWKYFLALKAKEDKRKTVYIGEGADEHFGGYETKTYLEAWSDHLTYIISTHRKIHENLDLHLEAPFTNLNWKKTLPYHSENKYILKEAYFNLLPPFILERQKTPPAYTNYWQLWFTKLQHIFPNYKPTCVEDLRKLLRYLACKSWLEANPID